MNALRTHEEAQEPCNSTFNKTFTSPFEFHEKPKNEYRQQHYSASTHKGNKPAQCHSGGLHGTNIE